MFAWPCAEAVQDINLLESQFFLGCVYFIPLYRAERAH